MYTKRASCPVLRWEARALVHSERHSEFASAAHRLWLLTDEVGEGGRASIGCALDRQTSGGATSDGRARDAPSLDVDALDVRSCPSSNPGGDAFGLCCGEGRAVHAARPPDAAEGLGPACRQAGI